MSQHTLTWKGNTIRGCPESIEDGGLCGKNTAILVDNQSICITCFEGKLRRGELRLVDDAESVDVEW